MRSKKKPSSHLLEELLVHLLEEYIKIIGRLHNPQRNKMSTSWASRALEYITLHQEKEWICNPFQLTVAQHFRTILSVCTHKQMQICIILCQLPQEMKIRFSLEECSQLLVESLKTSSMVTSNPLVTITRTTAQHKTINRQHINSLKPTTLQYPWHPQYLQTFKVRHLVTLAFTILNRPDHLIFKIHTQWSSPTKIHPGFQLFIIVRVVSITLLHLTLTKIIEIITMEIRFKVTIKDLTLREASHDLTTIIVGNITNSKCSFRLWIWVRACKSRCRRIIRIPTTIKPSSQTWWTLRTFSIKIKPPLWGITMASRSLWLTTKCSLT